jgi:hypothetical protein
MRLFLVALLYLGVIALSFHHNLRTLSTDLIGPPEDNMQDLWNVWYSQQLHPLPVSDWFFTKLIFYPEGVSLLYHSFAYTDLFAIRIIRAALGLPSTISTLVTFHNLMLLGSFFFSAMGMFLLAHRLTRNIPGSWLAGFIFAFSPFHFAHSLHHMHVSTIQFIPFFVLCALRFEKTEKWQFGIASAIFWTLSALSSWYYLVYNLLFLVFHYVCRSLQARKIILKPLLLQWGIIASLSLVFLAPLMVPMIISGRNNPGTHLEGHDIFVADVAGLVFPHPYHLAAGWFSSIHNRLSGNPWEMSVYLGLFNGILLIGALTLVRFRRNPLFLWCIGGMVAFTAIAAGRHLHVFGRVMRVPLPTALFEHLPLLEMVRTPSRAIVYTYLFLGLAVGIVVADILRRDRRRRTSHNAISWRRAIVFIAFAGVIIDFLSFSNDSTPVRCPAAYEFLAKTGKPGALLNLPMIYETGNRYMMYQLCQARPIVFATISRKINPTLSDRLESLSPQEKKDSLKKAGVSHVVVHRTLIDDRTPLDLTEYIQNYRLVFQDQEALVFEVE